MPQSPGAQPHNRTIAQPHDCLEAANAWWRPRVATAPAAARRVVAWAPPDARAQVCGRAGASRSCERVLRGLRTCAAVLVRRPWTRLFGGPGVRPRGKVLELRPLGGGARRGRGAMAARCGFRVVRRGAFLESFRRW